MNQNIKLYVVSDLHLEFSKFEPPEISRTADVICLAGDIALGDAGIRWARATWPDHEIVYVAGNHEYYGRAMCRVSLQLRKTAEETGVHFLENDEVVIKDTRFLGCTLWTDFLLFGEEKREEIMRHAKYGLKDFRLIEHGNGLFSPEASVTLHNKSVNWLDSKLSESYDGPTVVMTHHLPSPQLVALRYKQEPLCACFTSDCEQLLGRSAVWIAGHTHDSFDLDIKGTRVVVNPRGYVYPSRKPENSHFKSDLIVEVDQFWHPLDIKDESE